MLPAGPAGSPVLPSPSLLPARPRRSAESPMMAALPLPAAGSHRAGGSVSGPKAIKRRPRTKNRPRGWGPPCNKNSDVGALGPLPPLVLVQARVRGVTLGRGSVGGRGVARARGVGRQRVVAVARLRALARQRLLVAVHHLLAGAGVLRSRRALRERGRALAGAPVAARAQDLARTRAVGEAAVPRALGLPVPTAPERAALAGLSWIDSRDRVESETDRIAPESARKRIGIGSSGIADRARPL